MFCTETMKKVCVTFMEGVSGVGASGGNVRTLSGNEEKLVREKLLIAVRAA